MTYSANFERRLARAERSTDEAHETGRTALARADANKSMLQALRDNQLEMLDRQHITNRKLTTVKDEMDDNFALVRRDIGVLTKGQAELQKTQADMAKRQIEFGKTQADMAKRQAEFGNGLDRTNTRLDKLGQEQARIRDAMERGFEHIIDLLEGTNSTEGGTRR